MDSVATAHLAARLGMNSRRRCVVYPGVEGHFRPVSEMEIREVRQKHGLPEKYILTVGTIEPRKNHPILLRAIERLPHAPVLAVVGGAGWRCSQVMRSLGRLEGDGRVLYLGRVDDHDMPGLYGGALFLVCPSLYEGFGLPVAEAMACGCPVLCSWSSSLPEVAGRAAEYFPLGSHDVLVDKISGLLASERRRREMVEMGLERAREFRYSTAAATVLRELQAVLRAKPRSGNADRICVHAEEMRTRTASRGRTARCRTDYLDLS
jgi:alpha-1,3-rhamnosyl/mannosyltransferase